MVQHNFPLINIFFTDSSDEDEIEEKIETDDKSPKDGLTDPLENSQEDNDENVKEEIKEDLQAESSEQKITSDTKETPKTTEQEVVDKEEKEEEKTEEKLENVKENDENESPPKKPILIANSNQKSTETNESKEETKMELAHYFFSFLNKNELNVTLVGYFCRVLNHILFKKTVDVIILELNFYFHII